MKNYTSKHFDIQVNNEGIISCKLKSEEKFYPRHERKFNMHFNLGCEAANKLADPATEEWYNVCLVVMDCVFEQSNIIKTEVIGKMSYSYYYPKSLEEIDNVKKGFSFGESKAYVNGYADAVNAFKYNFNDIHEKFRYCLDTVFPTEKNENK